MGQEEFNTIMNNGLKAASDGVTGDSKADYIEDYKSDFISKETKNLSFTNRLMNDLPVSAGVAIGSLALSSLATYAYTRPSSKSASNGRSFGFGAKRSKRKAKAVSKDTTTKRKRSTKKRKTRSKKRSNKKN